MTRELGKPTSRLCFPCSVHQCRQSQRHKWWNPLKVSVWKPQAGLHINNSQPASHPYTWKKKVNKKQEVECYSVCLQPFLCMWPQGSFFFFFFSFSQHLNLEKSNLEILWKVKMSSVCFRACSLGSDSMCCSGDGWQQHGKLCTGLVKSRPSKEKERQASHYPRRQPQSPEGRELEQVLLCAMGIETVLPSLWSFMY